MLSFFLFFGFNQNHTVKLSIIMPIYNEAKTIREIVAKVLAVPLDIELIIVDDCSTDDTPTILKNEYEGNLSI
jgi:glycosyltransferase involved in cell wall biosynthesis